MAKGQQTAGIAGRVSVLWTLGGIVVSIVGAIVASSIYVSDLLRKIDGLENQVRAINAVLSYEGAGTSMAVTFNGQIAGTRCPPHTVMKGIQISYKDITSGPNGSIDCVNIKPADAR